MDQQILLLFEQFVDDDTFEELVETQEEATVDFPILKNISILCSETDFDMKLLVSKEMSFFNSPDSFLMHESEQNTAPPTGKKGLFIRLILHVLHEKHNSLACQCCSPRHI